MLGCLSEHTLPVCYIYFAAIVHYSTNELFTVRHVIIVIGLLVQFCLLPWEYFHFRIYPKEMYILEIQSETKQETSWLCKSSNATHIIAAVPILFVIISLQGFIWSVLLFKLIPLTVVPVWCSNIAILLLVLDPWCTC